MAQQVSGWLAGELLRSLSWGRQRLVLPLWLQVQVPRCSAGSSLGVAGPVGWSAYLARPPVALLFVLLAEQSREERFVTGAECLRAPAS